MRRIHLVHTSRYAFGVPVTGGFLEARLRPRELPGQEVSLHQLVARPSCQTRHLQDEFGNDVARIELEGPLRGLEVHAVSEVGVGAQDHLPPGGEVFPSALSPNLRRLALALSEPCFPPDRPLDEAAVALTAALGREFSHDRRAETREPPLEAVFRNRRGVCMDIARVALACLHARGLTARLAGGYLLGPLEPGKITRCEAHAWASVRLDDGRWIDVDPQRERLSEPTVITVGYGLEPRDISSIRGELIGGGRQRLEVKVWATLLDAPGTRP